MSQLLYRDVAKSVNRIRKKEKSEKREKHHILLMYNFAFCEICLSLLTHNRFITDLLLTYKGSIAEILVFSIQNAVYQLYITKILLKYPRVEMDTSTTDDNADANG